MATASRTFVRRERQPVPLVRREAEELMDLVGWVAQRQGELKAWLAERSQGLEEHATDAELRHVELRSRLERMEASVDHLAREVMPRRRAQRSQRVAVLRQQVSMLRGNAPSAVKPAGQATDRFGSALIYAGSLLLVWLVLWQLALAFGMR